MVTLHDYLNINLVEPFEFNSFRKLLVSYGVQVNYSSDELYIVKQKTEDPTFRKKLNNTIKNNLVSEKILDLNGVIVDRMTNEIVCMTYNTCHNIKMASKLVHERNPHHTKSLTEDEAIECLPKGLGTFPYITPNELAKTESNAGIRYQKMVDGVMIRVYTYNGKTKVATGRSINASDSTWSSGRTFGDMFKDTGKIKDIVDHDNFNPRHVYGFIMCHVNNKQVIRHKYNEIFHVFTRDMDTLEEIDVDIGINKLDDINPTDQGWEKPIHAYVAMQERDTPAEQGVMIIYENTGLRIPVMSAEYNAVLDVRGPYANLRCRAIEIACKEQHNADAFKKYYPNFAQWYDSVVDALDRHAVGLYERYVAIKVHNKKLKNFQISPREEQLIMRAHNEMRNENNAAEKAFLEQQRLKDPATVMRHIRNKNKKLRKAGKPEIPLPIIPDTNDTNDTNEPEKFVRKRVTKGRMLDLLHSLDINELWSVFDEKPGESHIEDWDA